MTEKEKMLSCQPYNAQDEQLVNERLQARQTLKEFNASDPADAARRKELLGRLFAPDSQIPDLEPPFYCDYGSNIRFGQRVFINFNCTVLDCAPVEIGDDTLIGPGAQIYTATHPLQPQKRLEGLESAKGVRIGKNVWLGGACVILPGIRVGDNAVVGAGAVVTHDVPANTVVGGNPAQIIRRYFPPEITQTNPEQKPPEDL